MTWPINISQFVFYHPSAWTMSSHNGRDGGYAWGQQHELPLIKANLHITIIRCLSFQQQRSILSAQYGTIPWGYQPVSKWLYLTLSLCFSSSFCQIDTYAKCRLPLLPTRIEPASLPEGSQNIWYTNICQISNSKFTIQHVTSPPLGGGGGTEKPAVIDVPPAENWGIRNK